MQTRIVALEGEVQKSRAQYQELEGSVTALASHLQVLSLPRGNLLAAMHAVSKQPLYKCCLSRSRRMF